MQMASARPPLVAWEQELANAEAVRLRHLIITAVVERTCEAAILTEVASRVGRLTNAQRRLIALRLCLVF